ncbi:MAG: hypothetical protein RJB11_2433 [Planctomycetota bacterium]
MSDRPSPLLRKLVFDLALGRCEYCLFPQDLSASSNQIDHIIAEKHGGGTHESNLALCYTLCNLRKGSDIGTLDPESGQLTALRPRIHAWREHFRMDGVQVVGLTAIGRASAHFLQLNSIDRLTERAEFARAGIFMDAHLARKPR